MLGVKGGAETVQAGPRGDHHQAPGPGAFRPVAFPPGGFPHGAEQGGARAGPGRVTQNGEHLLRVRVVREHFTGHPAKRLPGSRSQPPGAGCGVGLGRLRRAELLGEAADPGGDSPHARPMIAGRLCRWGGGLLPSHGWTGGAASGPAPLTGGGHPQRGQAGGTVAGPLALGRAGVSRLLRAGRAGGVRGRAGAGRAGASGAADVARCGEAAAAGTPVGGTGWGGQSPEVAGQHWPRSPVQLGKGQPARNPAPLRRVSPGQVPLAQVPLAQVPLAQMWPAPRGGRAAARLRILCHRPCGSAAPADAGRGGGPARADDEDPFPPDVDRPGGPACERRPEGAHRTHRDRAPITFRGCRHVRPARLQADGGHVAAVAGEQGPGRARGPSPPGGQPRWPPG